MTTLENRPWSLSVDRRPLILGQNPARSEPVLYDGRPGSSGDNLMRLFEARTGLARSEIRELFHWDNLVQDGEWTSHRAYKGAAEVASCLMRSPRPVVVLGEEVRRSLFMTVDRPLQWKTAPEGFEFAMLPHPSGLNRWYNDDRNRAAAELFLEALVWRSVTDVKS
jgi:uracil-DNA glycosylase